MTHGPLKDRQLPVIDLHMHPILKSYMFGFRFWNAHNPPGFLFPLCMRTDLDALIDGGVQCFLSTVFVLERGLLDDVWPLRALRKISPTLDRVFSEAPDDMAREQLNHFKKVVDETRRRRGDVIEIACSYSEMRRIMAEGKVCVVNSLEGAHHLNGKIGNVDDFFERGVSHMILAHFYPNETTFTVNAIPENLFIRKLGVFRRPYDLSKGLTDFGREVTDRMFDLGMIVDLTHGTPIMRNQVYEMARAHAKKRPVIMSHVGVHEYAPYPMNPTPEDIRQIADTGGTVGIIFMTYWLQKPEVRGGSEIILKTIDHLMQHGGEDVVAFGSDFDGFTGVPWDFKSPRDYNRLRDLLLSKYTTGQVEKFLSGNADRVLRTGWGKA